MNHSRSVLVVDDEPSILLLVRILLEEAGYRVRTCDTGEAALDEIRAEPPDAVLLDLRLPGIDGWEVLARLSAERVVPRLPVIVFSAHADVTHVDDVTAVGACAVVGKPFEEAELLRVLRAALAREAGERRAG